MVGLFKRLVEKALLNGGIIKQQLYGNTTVTLAVPPVLMSASHECAPVIAFRKRILN